MHTAQSGARSARSQTIHIGGIALPDGHPVDLFVGGDGRLSPAPVDDARTVMAGAFVLPGLVDMHTHLDIDDAAPAGLSPSELVRNTAQRELEAGVLWLREPGGWSGAAAGITADEALPHVITAGRFLAAAGGYFPGLPRVAEPAELRQAALDELQGSGGWVKVIGDYSDGRGGWRCNYPVDVLGDMVEAVHAAGGRCAIHAASAASVEAAIEAAFDTIEHGIGATPRHVQHMADRGIAWVPTLSILDQIVPFARGLGTCADELRHFTDGTARHLRTVRQAHESGVRVLAGTDAGMAPHGSIATEIALLARAGLPPLDAVAAGSWQAREFLGFDAVGQGEVANLVVYSADPREDLAVLHQPILIVLRGQVVRAAPPAMVR